ncbi:MAG: response regulator transcription factor [Lachnospiraceae bacterium]|nr:response regulator transcription factor [Lachnospiraceae bacterium]
MSDRLKIMVVDDDEHIAELISLYLLREGYETCEVYNGTDAIKKFEEFKPNLIMLDIMLPGIDGYQVCSEIRKISNVPVIMLTAKGDTFDKVLGLELGADDYMVKPFEPKELIARIKAVLRRYEVKDKEAENGNKLTFTNLEINMDNYTVSYHGNELSFPPKEFELLYFLAKRPNQVFTRDQLLDKIWGYEYIGDTRTVDVHIKRIREKFDESESWSVKTVWGVGYKFEVK